jgi:hypothetical protein
MISAARKSTASVLMPRYAGCEARNKNCPWLCGSSSNHPVARDNDMTSTLVSAVSSSIFTSAMGRPVLSSTTTPRIFCAALIVGSRRVKARPQIRDCIDEGIGYKLSDSSFRSNVSIEFIGRFELQRTADQGGQLKRSSLERAERVSRTFCSAAAINRSMTYFASFASTDRCDSTRMPLAAFFGRIADT